MRALSVREVRAVLRCDVLRSCKVFCFGRRQGQGEVHNAQAIIPEICHSASRQLEDPPNRRDDQNRRDA